MNHSLERTSPKGGPFFGTCIMCGETDLPISATFDLCPNTKGLTEQQVLEAAILGPLSVSQIGTVPVDANGLSEILEAELPSGITSSADKYQQDDNAGIPVMESNQERYNREAKTPGTQAWAETYAEQVYHSDEPDREDDYNGDYDDWERDQE